jgi:anhydro-N-acetylmuramic acid kinase
MLLSIDKLHQIAHKSEKHIIGLMSGTSLDGLDIAHCIINGVGRNTKVEVKNFLTVPYSEEFRNEIRRVFSVKNGDIEHLVLLHSFIGKFHGDLINIALKSWGLTANDIDVIASHGQTMYHAPAFLHGVEDYGNASLQIGDGDHIAVETQIITLSDFRMKHIAAGGEGAPLAVYGDYLIFSDKIENRIMLNIGGIANFTWLPNAEIEHNFPSFSTDVGPGNTIMDAFVQKNYKNFSYDVDGKIAASGTVNYNLLGYLKNHEFFNRSIPKTIGPELFNLSYLEEAIAQCQERPSNEDILATLNLFSAQGIVEAIRQNVPIDRDVVIYASGGGVHNKWLLQHIRDALPTTGIKNTNALKINPDAKEAVLFALLANECLSGTSLGIGQKMPGTPDVSMGKISFPD